MASNDDARNADLFDFVDAYLVGAERGEDLPLARWLERFPAIQAEVAREWLRLRGALETDAGRAAPAAEPPGAPAEGRVGPYRLIRELGRGGQGAVFLAEDVRIGRRVALKVLTSSFETISDEKRRRFRREAEVIARLEHPSLCTVYEADLEGPTPYIAMRYVEGRTLAEVVAEARRAQETAPGVARAVPPAAGAGPRPADGAEPAARDAAVRLPASSRVELHRLLHFFERAARALHAAHEAGVVHRDVKPGNVIVDAGGRPVLLDFGLARDERSDGARITESGDVFGTPAYMAPEQLELPSEALDRRTDVYALGVALYEALTLRRPFEQAARGALFVAITREPAPDPRRLNPHVDEDLKVVLETALEKDRARRYATALDLAEDLRRIRQYEPIRARPAGVGLRFARWVQRHPALAAATIGTILSLSIGLAVSLRLLAAESRAVAAKDKALREKDAALSVALGKHLAQRSVQLASQDAGAALAIGIEAAERAPGYLTLSALYPALDACWLERVLAGGASARVAATLEIDPRGQLVAAGFDDGFVHLWNLNDGALVSALDAGGALASLAFDPRGAALASATQDGRVRTWGTADGAAHAHVDGLGHVGAITYAADGQRLLVQAHDAPLRILDTVTLAVVAERAAGAEWARWAGRDAVVALRDGHAEVLDGEDLEVEARLSGPDGPAVACAVSVDGRRIALGTERSVVVLDRATRSSIDAFTPEAAPVRALEFAPDGGRLSVLSGPDAWVRPSVRDLSTRRSTELVGHGQRIVSAARFSPDGTRVATASHDLTLRVFDASSGAQERVFRVPLRQTDARWSPDGRRLVSRSVSGFAHVWFARARPDTYDLSGHGGAVRSLEVSAEGRRVLTASQDGTARVFHAPPSSDPPGALPPGAELARFDAGTPLVEARFLGDGGRFVALDAEGALHVARTDGTPEGAPDVGGPVAVIACAPGADRLAALRGDGRVVVWSSAEGARPLDLGRDGARAAAVEFLRDGARLVIGLEDGAVVLADARTGARLLERRFSRPGGEGIPVLALARHPTQDLVALACSDRRLRFWDLDAAPDAPVEERFVFDLKGITWDSSGRRVLALGPVGGRAVRVVDRQADAPVFPENAHAGDITCAALDPDGALAVTGASDGSVFVWDVVHGQPVVQRTDLTTPVRCVALARDGDGLRVIVGLESGRACVWPVDPLRAAKARKPRELASWERDRERALAAPLVLD